ncbi:MAG: zinc ribbon domain-containing protein, partial [Thermoplasmata archaeon]
MVKVCPNCNYQNPDSANICEVCGQPLNLSADPRIIESAIDGISSLRIGMLIVLISGLIGIVVAVINGTYASSLGFFSVFGSESSVPISTSPGSTTLIINSSSLFFSLLSSTVIIALFVVSIY